MVQLKKPWIINNLKMEKTVQNVFIRKEKSHILDTFKNRQINTFEEEEENLEGTMKIIDIGEILKINPKYEIFSDEIRENKFDSIDHDSGSGDFENINKDSNADEAGDMNNAKNKINSMNVDKLKKKKKKKFDGIYQCFHCFYETKIRTNLLTHIKRQHKRKNELFKCHNCNYHAKKKRQLVVHILGRHVKSQIFKCTECPYKSHIKVHLNLHILRQHILYTDKNSQIDISEEEEEILEAPMQIDIEELRKINPKYETFSGEIGENEFDSVYNDSSSGDIENINKDSNIDEASDVNNAKNKINSMKIDELKKNNRTHKHKGKKHISGKSSKVDNVYTLGTNFENTWDNQTHNINKAENKIKSMTTGQFKENKRMYKQKEMGNVSKTCDLVNNNNNIGGNIENANNDNNVDRVSSMTNARNKINSTKGDQSEKRNQIDKWKDLRIVIERSSKIDNMVRHYVKSKKNFNEKLRIITVDKPESKPSKTQQYKYFNCPFKALRKRDLNGHSETGHLNFDGIYQCFHCFYETKIRRNLLGHIRRQHKGKNQLFKSHNCDYQVKTKNNLVVHVLGRHVKSKIFKCTECPYKSHIKGYVTLHFRRNHIYTNLPDRLRKLLCTDCSYQSYKIFNFKRHMATHRANVEKLKCPRCEYSTRYKQHLTIHVARHSGQKFKCSECKYSANSELLLSTHTRNKHFEKKYSCTKCKYKTNSQSHLTRHFQAIHNPMA